MFGRITQQELDEQLNALRFDMQVRHDADLMALHEHHAASRNTSLQLSDNLFSALDSLFGVTHDGRIELHEQSKITTYHDGRVFVEIDPFNRTLVLIDTTGRVDRQDLHFDTHAMLDVTQRRLMIGFLLEIKFPIGATAFWHGTPTESIDSDQFDENTPTDGTAPEYTADGATDPNYSTVSATAPDFDDVV